MPYTQEIDAIICESSNRLTTMQIVYEIVKKRQKRNVQFYCKTYICSVYNKVMFLIAIWNTAVISLSSTRNDINQKLTVLKTLVCKKYS